MADEEKLIINVTYKCNNHCRFCSIADREIAHGDFDVQKAHIERAAEEGIRLLDIDGGEPTLYPRLFDLLDHALERKFERITITSNGRMLADAALVDRLARYPIDLLISLHAADASVQDDLTTQSGSFRQTVKGVLNAIRRFPNLGVNTTITTPNLDGLDRLADLLVKIGVKTWNLQYYTPFGKVRPELAPDPYQTGDMLMDVLQRYESKLAIQVVNLPFCFLPGYERFTIPDVGKAARRMLFVNNQEVNLGDYLATRRFQNGKCRSCSWSGACRGFWDYGDSPETGRPWRIRMLDVLPGYPCKAACTFCAVEEEWLDKSLTTKEVLAEIDRAMAYGPTVIRFGGGEPTERDDLPGLIRYAKKMEFERISVQTHGFRLEDRSYLQELVSAGANKFNISVRGGNAQTHELLTGVPSSFEKVVRAVRNVAERNDVVLELDGILTLWTVPELEDEIRFFHSQGARRFNYWFVQAEGRAAKNHEQLIPHMKEAARAFMKAYENTKDLDIESFRCYYIPYCFFKGSEHLVWHPLEENALVVTPTGSFTLDQGSLDLGVKTAICERCAKRASCFGIPPSYLKHFGDLELEPYSR